MENLYYFRKENDMVIKYDVNFDIGKLSEIKNIIKSNCSLIEHYDYVSASEPKINLSKLQVIGYKKDFKGKFKENDTETKSLYHFTYDQYNFPYLVVLINKLIDGDFSALDDIYNINFDVEINVPEYFESVINGKSKELDNIPNIEIAKKREKLDELEELMKQAKLNENQVSVIPFYKEVQEVITLTKVDEISIDDINVVNSFVGRELIDGEDIKKLNLKNNEECYFV